MHKIGLAAGNQMYATDFLEGNEAFCAMSAI